MHYSEAVDQIPQLAFTKSNHLIHAIYQTCSVS